MYDQTELWEFIQPYTRSAQEILFRLAVARGVATAVEAGGAITTNLTDYEFACLQVFISTEKLAASIAAIRGLEDRELVFAGHFPKWPLDPVAILPIPIEVDGQSFWFRPDDNLSPEALLRLRDEARQALQLESLRSPGDEISVDEIRAAADTLYDWLRSHMLVIPQYDGVAVFESDDRFDINCHLLPVDEVDWRGMLSNASVELVEELLDIGSGDDGSELAHSEQQATVLTAPTPKRGKKRTRARFLTTTHDTASEGLRRFIGSRPTGDDK